MGKLIYIADDDVVTRRLVQAFLEKEGFQVEVFENGDLLYEAFVRQTCDLIVLDAIMPGSDGFMTGAKIRQLSNVPVIMLTGQESDADYIFGISIGFDAYLVKPFNPAKLIAHVRTLLLKAELNKSAQPVDALDVIMYADITIYPNKLAAYCNDKELKLTKMEFNLLAFMFENKERVVSKEELLSKIWGLDSSIKTRVIDDTLKRLRPKLIEADSRVSIDTVWGVGFRLSANQL